VLLLLAAQSLRYLRHWKYDGREVGRFLVSAMLVAVLALMIASEGQAITTHRTVDQFHAKSGQKESVEKELLEKHPGQHVIFVRFTGDSNSYRAWIYNPADIDAAPVIWARDLGAVENKQLMHYYAGRSFWLFQPAESMNLTPY
jgi:hypothetical protein